MTIRQYRTLLTTRAQLDASLVIIQKQTAAHESYLAEKKKAEETKNKQTEEMLKATQANLIKSKKRKVGGGYDVPAAAAVTDREKAQRSQQKYMARIRLEKAQGLVSTSKTYRKKKGSRMMMVRCGVCEACTSGDCHTCTFCVEGGGGTTTTPPPQRECMLRECLTPVETPMGLDESAGGGAGCVLPPPRVRNRGGKEEVKMKMQEETTMMMVVS